MYRWTWMQRLIENRESGKVLKQPVDPLENHMSNISK